MSSIALFLATFYAIVTLSTWARRRIPAHQVYRPYDGVDPALPASLLAELDAKGAALERTGFVARGRIAHVRPDSAAIIASLYEAQGGRVTAVVLGGVRRGRDLRHGAVVNLLSELEDGGRIGTSNAGYVLPMPADPRDRPGQFPETRDPVALVALHEARLRQDGRAVVAREVGADAAAFFGERVDADMARQVALGTLRPAGKDGYGYTLRGAARLVWVSVPPSSLVAAFIGRLRARRVAAELEARGA